MCIKLIHVHIIHTYTYYYLSAWRALAKTYILWFNTILSYMHLQMQQYINIFTVLFMILSIMNDPNISHRCICATSMYDVHRCARHLRRSSCIPRWNWAGAWPRSSGSHGFWRVLTLKKTHGRLQVSSCVYHEISRSTVQEVAVKKIPNSWQNTTEVRIFFGFWLVGSAIGSRGLRPNDACGRSSCWRC